MSSVALTARKSWTRRRSSLSVDIDKSDFRTTLVIEESTVLRGSIVQQLKKQGWIAHGIRAFNQAFPLLKCIPYQLIVVGASASNTGAIEFARTLQSCTEWSKTHVVMITVSPRNP